MNKRIYLRVGNGGWIASAQNEAATVWGTEKSSPPFDKPSRAFLAFAPERLPNWKATDQQEAALRQRLDEMPIHWALSVVFGGGLCFANVETKDEVLGSAPPGPDPVKAIFQALDDAASKSVRML
jgi:hypothetical protein